MKTMMITGIGGDIAQCVATIVRETAERYRLVGTDTHDEHGGSLYADVLRRIPPAADPAYVNELLRIVHEESVDIVIPMSEPELEALGGVMEAHRSVAWITAGREVIRVGVDKLATVEALSGLGIPMPWTRPVSEGPPSAYPCIVKNRKGSGSRAVFKAADAAEASYIAQRHPNAVYQEYLEPAGGEVTCAVYRTRDGRVAVLQLLRRLVGGYTGWAEVIRDPAIEDLCIRAAEALDLRGSMNVQLRRTAAGPRVFEINPRFSSTVLMRHRIGFSDVSWSLQEYAGEKVELPRVAPGTRIVRTQGAAIINQRGQDT